MIVKDNEKLAKYTTYRVGGIARKFYIPENREELLNLLIKLEDYKILGGGSNLLINDSKIFDNIIKLDKFDQKITSYGEGKYYVGASVRLQKLINFINNEGYGGIEYLFSVPGLVGGAVVMNAGRGKQFNNQISDYIISVDVFHNGEIITLSKEDCLFRYKGSIFKNNNYIILGVLFQFLPMLKEDSEQLKRERIVLCNKNQDKHGTNFGSVFSKYDRRILKLVSKLSLNKKEGVMFSKKTINWICNGGKGTYSDTIKLIKLVKKIHEIFGKEIELEVVIWD